MCHDAFIGPEIIPSLVTEFFDFWLCVRSRCEPCGFAFKISPYLARTSGESCCGSKVTLKSTRSRPISPLISFLEKSKIVVSRKQEIRQWTLRVDKSNGYHFAGEFESVTRWRS